MADDFYKTLLESTKAIPWKVDWVTLQFSYIGPQIETLLGWSADSWRSIEDWAARIHPEDRESIVNFCVAQSRAGIDHEADYRAMTKDGRYVWIRDVVHVERNAQGEVSSLIGFMFDISERKNNEQALEDLQKELEALSYNDSITGVSNRRKFDAVMAMEWQRAQESQQPLSLILLDIDYFKQYNDYYGHLAGDACLKRVTHVLTNAGLRKGDFFARFGGEEFVIVLPCTQADEAKEIAEHCRRIILQEKIQHQQSSIGEVLSISLGVGTMVPTAEDDLLSFINRVDKCLYLAKRRGRNCTCAADWAG